MYQYHDICYYKEYFWFVLVFYNCTLCTNRHNITTLPKNTLRVIHFIAIRGHLVTAKRTKIICEKGTKKFALNLLRQQIQTL